MKSIWNAFVIPFFLVFILVFIFYGGHFLSIPNGNFGLIPRNTTAWAGVFTASFFHSDSSHLFNNSIPFIVMGTGLFYFFPKQSLWVLLVGWIGVNILVWIFGREAIHIGFSGVLYTVFAFMALSGFFRKDGALIFISFTSIFLYGSMVWGVFPFDLKISFESHLFGFLLGAILAYLFRKQDRLPPKKYLWDYWELDDDDPYWMEDHSINSDL